jgi:hypothetical protein
MSADAVEVFLSENPFETLALVDDLDENPVIGQVSPQDDLALPEHDRVGDELAGKEDRLVQLGILELRRPLSGDSHAGRAGRLEGARQHQLELITHHHTCAGTERPESHCPHLPNIRIPPSSRL